MRFEIGRREQLRAVSSPAEDFAAHLTRLLTDDVLTTLELWTQIKDHWNDTTFPLLTIRKLQSRNRLSCTIRINEAAEGHLFEEHTVAELRHLGWMAGSGAKVFYYKALVKSPDQFDDFCQRISAAMIEVLPSLFTHGRQYFWFS